jgi:hypothetical protein
MQPSSSANEIAPPSGIATTALSWTEDRAAPSDQVPTKEASSSKEPSAPVSPDKPQAVRVVTALRRLIKRRALRRAVRLPCIAVSTDGYRLVGQQVLDLSPRGVLVSSAAMLKLGDEIFISFLPPGDGRWMNAQAEVTRLIPGLRPWDPGPCAGLVFTNLSAPKRGELLARLAGIPPTVPRRPLRFGRRSRDAYANTVLPPVSRFRAPDGTWSDYYTRWNFLSLTSSAVAHGLFSNNYLKTVISTQQPVIQ